jgi:hypothetical protein
MFREVAKPKNNTHHEEHEEKKIELYALHGEIQ